MAITSILVKNDDGTETTFVPQQTPPAEPRKIPVVLDTPVVLVQE